METPPHIFPSHRCVWIEHIKPSAVHHSIADIPRQRQGICKETQRNNPSQPALRADQNSAVRHGSACLDMAAKPDVVILYLVSWSVQHHRETTDLHTSITTLTWVAIRERERHKDTKRPRETTLLSEHHYNTARRIDDSCKLKHYKLFCLLVFERYTMLMDTLWTLWSLSCALESYSCFIASFSSRYCRLLATGSRPTQRLRHQQLLPQIYRIAASSATFKASCWIPLDHFGYIGVRLHKIS